MSGSATLINFHQNHSEDEDYQTFKEALYYVNEYLAKCIASDGEGASAIRGVMLF